MPEGPRSGSMAAPFAAAMRSVSVRSALSTFRSVAFSLRENSSLQPRGLLTTEEDRNKVGTLKRNVLLKMLQLRAHTCDLLLNRWNTILEIMNNFKQ